MSILLTNRQTDGENRTQSLQTVHWKKTIRRRRRRKKKKKKKEEEEDDEDEDEDEKEEKEKEEHSRVKCTTFR